MLSTGLRRVRPIHIQRLCRISCSTSIWHVCCWNCSSLIVSSHQTSRILLTQWSVSSSWWSLWSSISLLRKEEQSCYLYWKSWLSLLHHYCQSIRCRCDQRRRGICQKTKVWLNLVWCTAHEKKCLSSTVWLQLQWQQFRWVSHLGPSYHVNDESKKLIRCIRLLLAKTINILQTSSHVVVQSHFERKHSSKRIYSWFISRRPEVASDAFPIWKIWGQCLSYMAKYQWSG